MQKALFDGISNKPHDRTKFAQKQATRRYLALHPEKKAEKNRRYREANREKVRAADRRWRAANRRRQKLTYIKRNYGLSRERFEEMYDSQGGKCAICHSEFESDRNIQIDHSHETGEVRAILCGNCNSLLGHAKENPEILKSAVQYLEVHAK